jgi:glycosyltransferase involved in cell wall biosynthesis
VRITIISVNPFAPWGGSEELWSQAALELLSAGAELQLVRHTWNPEPAPVKALCAAGARFVPITARRDNVVLRMLKRLRRRASEAAMTVRRAIVPFSPQMTLVAQGGQYEGWDWMVALAETQLRYSLLVQTAGENFWPIGDELQALRKGFMGASRCFFVSEANRAITSMQIGDPLSRSDIVAQPFNVPYDVDLPWPESSAEELRLATVGRLSPPHKGHDLLFRVLAQPKWRERNLTLDCYGECPIHGEHVKQLAEMLKLSSVHFCGHVSDVRDIWRTHHALILASRTEGLPLAAMEAMLCGRPCILTDVGGNSEIIVDDQSGFLAGGPAVAALDEAMERAWSQRANLSALGRQASLRVRELIPARPGKVFAARLWELAADRETIPSKLRNEPRNV